ncbi:hypothetical protein OF001_U100055 [Pseudomonas sp. OF001]|nr:hypothetical protein OF001_U100055 [Pseudomonas sp. OF001]
MTVDAGGVPRWGMLGAVAGHLGNRQWLSPQHRPAGRGDQQLPDAPPAAACRERRGFFHGVFCRYPAERQVKGLSFASTAMLIWWIRYPGLNNHCDRCAARGAGDRWHSPCYGAPRKAAAAFTPSTRAKRTP